jgi:cation diffusion facilitator CzcD-associated flavoprotein CzcO
MTASHAPAGEGQARDPRLDVIVIGAGQAGLARAPRWSRLRFVVR